MREDFKLGHYPELPLVCGHLGLWEWSRELKG